MHGSSSSSADQSHADTLAAAQSAVADVLHSGWLTLGPVTAELERVVAEETGAEAAVATTGLGDAIELVLSAIGVKSGDEVFIGPGCPPVCGAMLGHMDLVAADAVGTDCVAMFVATDDDALIKQAKKLKLKAVAVSTQFVRETTADALCAGLLQDGTAAAVVTGSAEFTDRVRQLRSHAMTSGTWARHTGKETTYDVVGLGFNHRIDEQRSALALVELGRPRLERDDSGQPFGIPLTDIKISDDDVDAVLAQLPGWQMGGPVADELEAEFAAWTGSPHVVAVSSGSSALELALRAAEIGPGDEVLIPDFTFVASVAAVRHCGATPVLCDVISPSNPLLDPADAEARITPNTRAIIPVHFFGATADMKALNELAERHSLIVIEDAAQAVGARIADSDLAGTASFAGCFSLFSKKQLCCGEGGLITCSDAKVAKTLRRLRDEGPGYHLGEPAAALALSRLERLRSALWARHESAHLYRELLADIDGAEPVFDDDAASRSSNFAFCVLFADRDERDRVRADLAADGIQTTWYPAVHFFSEYEDAGDRPQATAASERHAALPLSSSSTRLEIEQVVAALKKSLAA